MADDTGQTNDVVRRRAIGTPHLRVGEKSQRFDLGDALARRYGVWVVPVACGKDDVPTTAATGFADVVRCPDCRAQVPHLYRDNTPGSPHPAPTEGSEVTKP